MSLWAAIEPAARPIVAMLFNGLWQGALVAFAVWAILRAFPGANASTRYAAWSAALVAILVVPFVTTVITAPSDFAAAKVVHGATARASAPSTVAVAEPLPGTRAAAPAVRAPAFSGLRLSAPGWLAVGLFALWAAIALASFLRLTVSLFRLERLKSDALPLAVEYRDAMSRWAGAAKGSRGVRICVSDEIDVPVAVGLFDAMILLPKRLLQSLDPHEIDQISLHELAHLRRADDWTNGLQRIAQALLFFNPAVAFVARQMDLEREVACDDWVLSLTGDVRPYAFCLTKMAEVAAWPHRALAAPGVFVTRKSISIRIERILAAKRAIGPALSPGVSSVVLGALVAAFFVLRTVTPSIAYTVPQAGIAAAVAAPDAIPESPPKEPQTKNSPAPHRGSPLPVPTERPPAVVPGGPKTMADASVRKALAVAKIARENVVFAKFERTKTIAAMTGSLARAGSAAATVGAFTCTGCDMHGVHWAGRDMHGASLEGVDFANADLHGANFSRAKLLGADFRNANLDGVSFAGAELAGCDLRGASVTNADFRGASLTGCSIDASRLSASQAQMLLSSCGGCSFHGADLHGRDLRGVTLAGIDLGYADLRGVDFSHATLTGVDLSHARLDGAKLDGTHFIGCDFASVDLRGVDLSRADLTGSALAHAIMR